MMNILKEVGLDSKDVRIIGNLYWNQTACLRIDGITTENVKILRGVRQGCQYSMSSRRDRGRHTTKWSQNQQH